MLASLKNIYRLGVKELFSLRSDTVMMVLIVYTFTFAVYTTAQHAQMELRNASVAMVDEDCSQLSQRIHDALLPPYFQRPVMLQLGQIDAAMEVAILVEGVDGSVQSHQPEQRGDRSHRIEGTIAIGGSGPDRHQSDR